MNAGKKLVRNTVFGLWGAAALFVGLNRLNATPTGSEGSGSFLTLGLRQDRDPQPRPQIDLAAAMDFTRLSVRGPLNVEVVGAEAYKVTLVPTGGQAPQIRAFLEDGVLRVDGGDQRAAASGTLRVEVPTLERMDIAAQQLTIRGVTAPSLRLAVYDGGSALLQQNQVQQWQVFAEKLDLQVDDATFAAGTLKTAGDVVIRRAP